MRGWRRRLRARFRRPWSLRCALLRPVCRRRVLCRRVRRYLEYSTSGLSAYLNARDGLPYFEKYGILGERLEKPGLAAAKHGSLVRFRAPTALRCARRISTGIISWGSSCPKWTAAPCTIRSNPARRSWIRNYGNSPRAFLRACASTTASSRQCCAKLCGAAWVRPSPRVRNAASPCRSNAGWRESGREH